jgi:multidrug efflux pump subunit AcrA (membrane-fusion protein)
MANPGLWITIASAVMATYAQREQQQNAQAVAEHNRRLALQRAADARLRGDQAEIAERRRLSQLLGAQRAIVGASGALVDVGSPLVVQEDTAAQGELNVLVIRNNASREAYGFETQSSIFALQASQASSNTPVFSTALGGAADSYGYYQSTR